VLAEAPGLSIVQAAKRYVLHRNTLSRWFRVLRGRKDPNGFLGAAPFNKIGDAVRWLVHEYGDVCGHLEWGTRAIADKIKQLGVEISRSTVQRILREGRPKRPKRHRVSDGESTRAVTEHILHPKKRNRTWHVDLTVLDVFGMRFHVAALLDGFSRRLLALKVYARTPTAAMMAGLVKRVVKQVGEEPRFVVSDHGTQFMRRFESLLAPLANTTVVRGRVGNWRMNGKVERFFRTFKWWTRRKLWASFAGRTSIARSMQRRLDVFRDYYNDRVHQGIGGLTPNQKWDGVKWLEVKPIRVHDPQPEFTVTRRWFRGDRLLAVVEVSGIEPAA